MKIHLYSFSKRKNSTKQPPALGYTELTVKWKEDTSINNPSFVYAGNLFTYTCNYVHIPDWNKYYWVNDIVLLANNLTQIDLSEDVMSTNKSAVGATKAFIAYSSTGYDTWKIDSRLPAKTTKTVSKSSGVSPGIFSTTGCYVIGVSNNIPEDGPVTYYALNQANFVTLIDEIMTDTTLQTAIKNYTSDAWNAIMSCIWVPFSKSEIPGSATDVAVLISNKTTSATGKRIDQYSVRASNATVSIPWTYSDFRRTMPYTTMQAWIPGFGFIDINNSDLIAASSIKFDFKADCKTGDMSVKLVSSDSSKEYQTLSYNVAVPVALSNYTEKIGDIINSTTGFLSQATNTALSVGAGSVGGAVAGVTGMIGSGVSLVLAANSRSISFKGSQGGKALIANGTDCYICTYAIDTEDPDAADYIARWGRPVGKVETISSHSGYVQCENASVEMAGELFERDEINSYLNSGFYYE